ncbi:hypothetical protein CKAH01_03335 [Colletotrichum kahawae]|uniref:Uncharacterized protein n=1 Tax=Colletotrichum kahawae TaxID=34407 RepID=A0AAE0DBB8_COLKA|nr:hypothetical protein CKAH01_03335 [Colletotrichum kahawae]
MPRNGSKKHRSSTRTHDQRKSHARQCPATLDLLGGADSDGAAVREVVSAGRDPPPLTPAEGLPNEVVGSGGPVGVGLHRDSMWAL